MQPFFGVFEDRILSQLLCEITKYIKNPVIIIRSLDSSFSLEDISRILDFHKIPHEKIHNNITLFYTGIQKIITKNIFNGFDEIWVYDDAPPSFNFLNLPSCTSDASNFEEGVDEEILQAFRETGAKAVLADGCGLNYIACDQNILEMIKKE